VLYALNKGFWRKAGVALGLFAAVCFALPPAVLAMGHGANTMHCLSHADRVDHGMKTGHTDRGAMHDAADDAIAIKDKNDRTPSGGDRHMSCCGLYCLSAVAPVESGIATPPILGVPRDIARGARLVSRTPPLPEHPPKPRLFV
jgi:hypothetical protein